MTLIQHAITRGGVNSLLDTLRSYLVRYRLARHLLLGAVVVLGRRPELELANRRRVTAVVAVLPCALIMFSCIRPGSQVR